MKIEKTVEMAVASAAAAGELHRFEKWYFHLLTQFDKCIVSRG